MDFLVGKNEHMDALKSLWKTCFYDDTEYINWSFTNRFSNEEVLSLWDGKQLSAMTSILSYDFSIHEKVLSCGFIEGLCTAPAYRMNHLGKKLMEKSLSMMKNRGQIFGMLVPFHSGYYEKMGFSLMSYLKKITVPIDEISDSKFEGSIKEASNLKETALLLNSIYEKYMEKSSCFQKRSLVFWKNILDSAAINGAKFYILYREKVAVGYAYIAVDKEEIQVFEMGYTDEKAYDSLLAFFKSYKSQTKRLILTLSNFDNHYLDFSYEKFSTMLFPYAMIRIVDVLGVLNLYRDVLKKEAVIEVTDSLCLWNNGIFVVKDDQINLTSRSKVKNIDVTLDIKTLSDILLGSITPIEAKERNALSGDETVFPKNYTIHNHYANLLFD